MGEPHFVEAITEISAAEFLREKGYTVIPKERVRILTSCTEVNEEVLQTMADNKFLDYLKSNTANIIAHKLLTDFEGLTYYVEFPQDPYGEQRRRYRTELAVILPKRADG